MTSVLLAIVLLQAHIGTVTAYDDDDDCERVCGLECSDISYCDVDFSRNECRCIAAPWFISIVTILPLICCCTVAACIISRLFHSRQRRREPPRPVVVYEEQPYAPQAQPAIYHNNKHVSTV